MSAEYSNHSNNGRRYSGLSIYNNVIDASGYERYIPNPFSNYHTQHYHLLLDSVRKKKLPII